MAQPTGAGLAGSFVGQWRGVSWLRMLRCAGCGDLVSEFAARCPACHWSTDDAGEVDDQPPGAMAGASVVWVGGSGGTVLEPDLDPTGPIPADGRYRREWRRWTILLAVVVTAIVGGSWLGSPGASLPAGGPSLAGLAHDGWVVSESSHGSVVVTDPSGSYVQALQSFPLQPGSSDQELVVAADDRFLMSGIHTLIAATGAFPQPIDSNVLFTPAMTPVQSSPFADGDRAVVVLTGGPALTSSLVSLVLVADGATLPLGEADQAAGDPESLGAFVTVAAPVQPKAQGGHGGRVDTWVELRHQGETALLATAVSLNRDLGQTPNRPVTLQVLPNSSGNELAVVVEPAGSAGADAGVVVLDRRGRVLSVLDSALGPARGSMPSWSPDGSALAYYTVTRSGAAIAVWTVGQQPDLRAAPNPTASFYGCLWAPDGSMLLCPTMSGTPQWIFARADSGRLMTIKAPAFVPAFAQRLRPVAWLSQP